MRDPVQCECGCAGIARTSSRECVGFFKADPSRPPNVSPTEGSQRPGDSSDESVSMRNKTWRGCNRRLVSPLGSALG